MYSIQKQQNGCYSASNKISNHHEVIQIVNSFQIVLLSCRMWEGREVAGSWISSYPQPNSWWNISPLHALWNCNKSCRTQIFFSIEFHWVGARALKALAEESWIFLRLGTTSRFLSTEPKVLQWGRCTTNCEKQIVQFCSRIQSLLAEIGNTSYKSFCLSFCLF